MQKRILFHEQLVRIRKQRSLTQEALARILDVEQKTIGRWERQESFPTLSLHKSIAKALGKTVEELGLYASDDEIRSSENLRLLNLDNAISKDNSPTHSDTHDSLHEDSNAAIDMVRQRIKTILRDNAFVDHTVLFGVDDILEKMREYLVAEQSAWIISLFGEGGLGKTALAYEIVARYAADAGFRRVAWVSAKTAQILPDGTLLRGSSAELRWSDIIKKIADQLELSMSDGSISWISDFQHALRALPSQEKCLLVIDNLETVEDVTEAIHYLCGPGSGMSVIKPHKIIITTRRTIAGKAFHVVEKQLTGLHPSTALQFIRELGNEEIHQASDDELMPIVDATEGNPLLLKLCITRFLTSFLPLSFVLTELQEVNKLMGKNVIDYLYFESLSLLQERCGEQMTNRLLNAFCPLSAGESIEYLHLFSYSGIPDEEVFKNVLQAACELSLIRASSLKRMNRSYSIHSLLWKFICHMDS